jgi:hypothetical protein
VLAAGLTAGCSSAKKAAPPPPCLPAHPGQYLGTGAALGDRDAGGTYCVTVGETLSVTLHVAAGDTGPPWQPMVSADKTVLAPTRDAAAKVPARATATFFSVRKAGVVAITATRTGPPLFKVTVVAQAK